MFAILSVNVSKPVPFEHTGPKVTGIFKKPVAGAVRIGLDGVEGDSICDQEHHGGPDQMVYIYGQPDYDFWSAELGRTLEPGTFGENLTLTGLESAKINVGDSFVLGQLVLEATAPRIPCRTFAARMEDKHFVEKFMKARRPGVYCRVISPGPVKAGERFAFEPFKGPKFPMDEFMANWARKAIAADDLRRYLATPLHEKSRAAWTPLLTP
jgi:MOSC domain-containing protein YiiM